MTAGGNYGGGWTCPTCGVWTQYGANHVCYGRTAPPPTWYPNPLYQPLPYYAPLGWACPRCGVVHAPSVLRCDCKPSDDPNTPDDNTGNTLSVRAEPKE